MSKAALANEETQAETDHSAALAEISNDLFGQDESAEPLAEPESPGAPVEETPEESSATVEVPPPEQSEEKPENSAEVQAIGAPDTWTKEALAEWASVPPRVQQEITKREQDFLNGIQMYKSGAELGQRYESVVEPYRPILAAENIDPVQLFQSFAANHYLLSRGTPEQKINLAASMIHGYGIDLNALISHIGEQRITPPNPEVESLRRELQELKSFQARQTQSEQEAIAARLGAEIEAFSKDPAHPYFDEVADDITKLFESRQATTLAEAYEKAVWQNPSTRQKELDRITSEKTSLETAAEKERQAKVSRALAAEVSTTTKSRNGAEPVGSLDDTLSETMSRIKERGN